MQWSDKAIEKAAEALSADFKPLTDARGTSAYRLQIAANMHTACILPAREPFRLCAVL